VLGALAIAKAAQILEQIGWDTLTKHETSLLTYTLTKLRQIPNLTLYQPAIKQNIGVISFNIPGIEHSTVAKYLAEKKGIGVRSGCFCARSYVQSLLKLSPNEIKTVQENIGDNNLKTTPGMIRVSFGCYNKFLEVDYLVEALYELCEDYKNLGPYLGLNN
jgi:selenocysteine lyase/cysteine desulfurase